MAKLNINTELERIMERFKKYKARGRKVSLDIDDETMRKLVKLTVKPLTIKVSDIKEI